MVEDHPILPLGKARLAKLLGAACELHWSDRYWAQHDIGFDPAHRAKACQERRLLAELASLGLKGDPSHGIVFTRSLPPGCDRCLKGRGACVSVTHVCTRDCFFCPNGHPRRDEIRLSGFPPVKEGQVPGLARRLGLKSLGISGGDPLTRLPRTLRLARSLRRRLGPRLWMQLYTNGDLLTDSVLRRLKQAGIRQIRVNVAANGFDLAPVMRALAVLRHVAVEVPVVPAQEPRLRRLIDALDAVGVAHLVLHELSYAAENARKMSRLGYRAKSPQVPFKGMRPVSDSGLAALRLLKHALKTTRSLSVYYCSHDTIELINERGARLRLARLMPIK